MEPSRKRPRVSQVKDKDLLDPDFDLQESRARNDLRLKSTFEAIFKKYEHDFTGIGDEIDLQTGEIVVNNGHIMDMRSEHDIGDRNTGRGEDLRASTTAIGEEPRPRKTSSLLSEDFDRLSNGPHEEVKVCADIAVQSDDDVDSLLGLEQDTNLPTELDPQMEDMWSTGHGGRDRINWNQNSLPRGLPSQQAILSQFGPMLGLQIADLVHKVRNPNDAPVEEAWHVPDLPPAPPAQRPILKPLVNMRRERSLSPLNQTSIWAPPRSSGWPKKDGSVVFDNRIPTGNSSLTARPEAPDPDNTLVHSQRNDHDEVIFGDGSYRPSSKRKLHGSPLRHLPSPQENGADLYAIEQSNTGSHHQILSQQVNRKASHITPKSSPLHNPNTLRDSQGSSLKRKRLQQSKQTTETVSERDQSLKKQNIEHHIRPGQIAILQSGADSQNLVSPRSNQSPCLGRKQLTSCTFWTHQEEELLRHLKENTALAYTQLVEYFPGKTKDNIRAHYLLLVPGVKLRPQKSKSPPGPPYTPQEDELLLDLRGNKGLPWKDTITSFPARTINSLTYRYYKVLQVTPSRRKQTTSKGPTSATSEEILHIGPLGSSFGVTPTEHKVLEDLRNTDSSDRENILQTTPERTEADPKALCEVVDNGQPLLPSRMIEKTPLEHRTAKLDPPSSAALKVVIQTSTPEQRQYIAHGEGVTTAMATPASGPRLQSQSKDLSAERTSSLKGEVSQRSKSSHKKASQSRISQSTPTASMKPKVTKPRTTQVAGTKASPKTLTPWSKAALVSLLGDITDDEDELSIPVTTLGSSKDRPLTTPTRTVGQGCMGKSCDRKFCFKCM